MSFTYPNNYFLSSVSSNGFLSLFDENLSPSDYTTVFILKGSVGMKKSDALISVAERLNERGITVFLAQNPRNPDLVEGVFAPDIKLAAVIGSFPHNLDEKIGGVREIAVDFNAARDNSVLKATSAEIISAYNEREAYFGRAGRYLSAARSLLGDSFMMAADVTDGDRAAKFGMMAAAKLLGKRRGGKGRETRRFLSAVTPRGLVFRDDTLLDAADRFFIIDDRFSAAAKIIIAAIRYSAIELGLDVISCVCPLFPDRAEHVIVPELRVAFCTENRYLSLGADLRRYHSRRFMDMSALSSRRQRLLFNKKATDELISGCVGALKAAQEQNELISSYYDRARRPDVTDEITYSLLRQVDASV